MVIAIYIGIGAVFFLWGGGEKYNDDYCLRGRRWPEKRERERWD